MPFLKLLFGKEHGAEHLCVPFQHLLAAEMSARGTRLKPFELVAQFPGGDFAGGFNRWVELAKRIEAGLHSISHLPIQLIWGLRDWCFRPECLEQEVVRRRFIPQADNLYGLLDHEGL